MVIATLYGYKIKGEENGKHTSFQGQGLMNFLCPWFGDIYDLKFSLLMKCFHVTDSPCLLELLCLKTLLTGKWLILLFVILITLANINRWLNLLTKHIWESCGTQSCLYVISYLSTLCGGGQEEKKANTHPSQSHVIICPTQRYKWISIICSTVSMVIF